MKGKNLKFGDCQSPKYIIRTEYATVSQDLINTISTKNQLVVWFWKKISKIRSLE